MWKSGISDNGFSRLSKLGAKNEPKEGDYVIQEVSSGESGTPAEYKIYIIGDPGSDMDKEIFSSFEDAREWIIDDVGSLPPDVQQSLARKGLSIWKQDAHGNIFLYEVSRAR